MSFFYGIDFGTTNCAVVAYDERTQKLRNIGDILDNNPIPSVVAIRTFNDEVRVGREVKNNMLQMLTDGRHLVFQSVKSFLDKDVVKETDSRSWNAEEVSAELFRTLAERVRAAGLPPMEKAVVSIPIGMTPEKRRVLRRAANKAGLDIITFISEPTSAFIAHADQLKSYRNIVVFDWGGGTLDISVLLQRNDTIIERYTAGIHKAGDLIDKTLAEWAHEQIVANYGLNLPFSAVPPANRQILRNECERVKIALQEDGVDEGKILLGDYAGQKMVSQVVKRSVFEDLIRGLVTEAIDLLIESIHKSGISQSEIGKVLVVGGTSKLKLFQNELRRQLEFPDKLIFPDGAEWDIARGAAYLAQSPGCYRTAESIGLELCDGEFYPVIPSKTSVEDSYRRVGLGLIEDTKTATFVFATQKEELFKHDRIGYLHAPCIGFSDEIIQLDCHITEDLTFVAKAISSHIQNNNFNAEFSFDKLRWQYDLGR